MKQIICDRCKKECTNDYRTITVTPAFLNMYDGHYDLCKVCSMEFEEFLTGWKIMLERPVIKK